MNGIYQGTNEARKKGTKEEGKKEGTNERRGEGGGREERGGGGEVKFAHIRTITAVVWAPCLSNYIFRIWPLKIPYPENHIHPIS